MSTPDSAGWSIDQLAQLAGIPSRTIREYRTLGVLAPPSKVGRVGIYADQHLRRLQLISRLQKRGYSLAGIRDLFDAWQRGESLDDVIGDGGIDEAVITLTTNQLVERAPALRERAARADAARAELIHAASADTWHVRSPSLLTLVDDATQAGIPLDSALDVVRAMREGAQLQAAQLSSTFIAELWSPKSDANLEHVVRRFRILIARSVSALVVDELGRALRSHATQAHDDSLHDFVNAIAIGNTDGAGPRSGN